jgi:dTMP kinase
MEGKLIVFEGVARSGKSTLINMLGDKLKKYGYDPIFTEWNSYEPLQEIINHKKTHFTFSPLTYSLLHLSEFALRYEEMIKPALENGQIVIADRWVYTAFTRDAARGVSPEYVRDCYRFAREPDATFYVEVPCEVALQRHYLTKPYFGYNSGTDIWTEVSNEEAFKRYYQQLTDSYSGFMEAEKFFKLNGLDYTHLVLRQICDHLNRQCGFSFH